MADNNKVPVSVLIPTRNEERNIVACIDGVDWADEVVVFDSLSDDTTVEIATGKGATVIQREFDNFADHKNWALENVSFAHDWILIVDADERVTPELASDIKAAIASAAPQAGYYIARKNIFSGRWIRRAGMYPDWQLRLFQSGKARYEQRIVHEHMILDGGAGYLKHPFIHHDDKGIERYIDRHNTYSSFEAFEAYKYQQQTEDSQTIASKVGEKGPEHRRSLKQFAYRYLPFRPLFVFFWMYIFRLGILDGKIGFRYCVLRAIYEFQIDLKLDELKRDGSAMQEKFLK